MDSGESEADPPGVDEIADTIAKLAELNTQGVLSDDELKAATERLLGAPDVEGDAARRDESSAVNDVERTGAAGRWIWIPRPWRY